MQDTIADFLGAEVPVEEEVSNEVAVVENQVLDLAKQAEIAKEAKFNDAQDYVNDNMKKIIELGMDGLNEIMDVMNDSQDPKMYNACASYIKTLVDANKSFLENNKYGVPSLGTGATNGGFGKQKETPQAVTQIQVNNGDVKVLSPHQLLEDDD